MYDLKAWPDGDAKVQYAEILKDQFDGFVSALREREPGLDFTVSLVEHENETQGILEHLRSCGADLAVIGSHGHSRFRELLLGSTTERLIHGSECSVFVVKPDRKE